MTNGDNILEQELLKQETSDKTVVQLGLMLGNKIEITVEKKLMNVLFCKGCVPSLKKNTLYSVFKSGLWSRKIIRLQRQLRLRIYLRILDSAAVNLRNYSIWKNA